MTLAIRQDSLGNPSPPRGLSLLSFLPSLPGVYLTFENRFQGGSAQRQTHSQSTHATRQDCQRAADNTTMASRAMIPFLVGMMLFTGVCNTLLTKYQVSYSMYQSYVPATQKSNR